MKCETFWDKMCNLNFSRLTTEQAKISEKKTECIYTMYSGELSALPI